MNCDFVKSLTAKQKAELRKLLETEETTLPKYEVKVEFWDNGNICNLIEYQDDQQHGKYIGWWKNRQKQWEVDYYQGKRHGKCIEWHENGQKYYEADYKHGKLVKEYER